MEHVYSVWRRSSLPSLASLGSLEIRHNYLVLGHSPWGFLVRLFSELIDRTLLEWFFLNLVILITSYLSDHYQSRGIAVALITTLAVAGYYSGTRELSGVTNFVYSTAANDKFVTYGAST